MLATNSSAQTYHAIEQERAQNHSARTSARQKTDSLNRISMVMCIVVAIGAVWFVCAQGAQIYNLSYGNVKLQSQMQELAANNASLTAQMDGLEKPSRILGVAMNKYHMQYANTVRIGGSATGK